MPTFKLVLSDPLSGKARQFEIKDPASQKFIGLKIGDVVDASVLKGVIDLPQGLKIRITGGSGIDGAPMIPYVQGPVKKYVLLSRPPGFHPRREGERRRKLVYGNTISDRIVQINAVIVYPEGWSRGPVFPLGEKEMKKLLGGSQESSETS